jgi:hypothetical protein
MVAEPTNRPNITVSDAPCELGSRAQGQELTGDPPPRGDAVGIYILNPKEGLLPLCHAPSHGRTPPVYAAT